MLRLTLVISWKLTATLTGIDLIATTVEIVAETVRTARTRSAKPPTPAVTSAQSD